MQTCEYRDGIIAGRGLDLLLESCFSQLKTNLFQNAIFVNPSVDVAVTLSKPHPHAEIIPAEKRIVAMEGIDMFNNRKTPSNYRLEMIPGLRGVHVPSDGKIYLQKSKWCVETVIHELLHACSVLSLVDQMDKKYVDFNEGLTEFLTGYLLYKDYPEVYQNCWRARDERQCKMTYVHSTRLWGAFCHFVPIREVLPIYLYNGSTDYPGLLSQFTNRMHQLGHTKFQNPLSRGTMPVFERFKTICRDSFPSFENVYSSHEKSTDFSQIQF